MVSIKKQGFAFITIVYWFLLVYIIAALVYWFLVLERQNDEMTALRAEQLKKDAPVFTQQFEEIQQEHWRKKIQYISEGTTFLLLIIVGASFVYRAVRKQLMLSRQQQNFMMAVTHELKTPIAVARLNLETLQKRKLDEAMQQKLLANALDETNRLNTLTNNILVAAQLEMETYRLNRQPLNFSNLVKNGVKDFKSRFLERVIELNTEDDIMINAETTLLQLVLNNLIDNALKYSQKQAPVVINLQKKTGSAILTVADKGVGIDDEEKKKIFDKFYRVGNEATRKAKGTGLGLYLCRKIVKDHNGSITVSDNLPQGAVFTVTLKAL
ncbi:MAG TPA: ATP-binding protein [Chitinophagaceae bacterium]|nr:ATP-binding protein [Chitinophagaceae bacterium]